MKTAMQELREYFLSISHKNPHLTAYNVFFKIDEFLEKEKEQVVDAYNHGYRDGENDRGINNPDIDVAECYDAEQYYNETFKQ